MSYMTNNKVKVVNKGYTIKVMSWENDEDNYQTHQYTVNNLEETKKVKFILDTLCKKIGNASDQEHTETVLQFFREYPIYLDVFASDITEEERNDDEAVIEYFNEWHWELLGYSDWYDYRVFQSIIVTYSDKDIYVDKIEL